MQLAHVHDLSAPAVAAAQQQTTLDGQVTYRRRLSSKLVFYDVLQAGTEDSWWEVVVKVGDEAFGSIQAVKDLRDSLKLGDTVRVTGWREAPAGHPALGATSIQVTQPWRQQHPDTGFIPQPAPKVHHHQPQHAHTPQQQQTPALQAQQLGRSTAQQQQHADSTQSAGDPSCIPAAEGVDTASGIAAASTDGPAAQAARVTGPQVSVCKFWVNTGRCAKGAQCPFLHTLLPAAGGVSRKTWVQKRELERQQRAADKGFVHNSSAAAKRKRARVFAAWLVQQYGKERLSAGSGVLDVAGGRGSLTFELAYVHGIKCTLIDPRPLKLNKLHHRQLQQAGRTAAVRTHTLEQLQQGRVGSAAVMYEQEQLQSGSSSDDSLVKQEHKQSLQQQAVTDTIQQQQQQQQQQHARPIQTAAAQCLQPDSQTISQNEAQGSACLSQSVLGADALQRSIQQQQQQQQQQQPAPGSFDTAVQLFQVQAWFGSELWNTPGWQQLFKDCSLVVGLHPDQATEPILDFAVQQQLPFAVVPCCVFPRLFPQRQLQQGDGSFTPVVAYVELVEYLVQRGSANKGVLDFEGANTIVYRL